MGTQTFENTTCTLKVIACCSSEAKKVNMSLNVCHMVLNTLVNHNIIEDGHRDIDFEHTSVSIEN